MAVKILLVDDEKEFVETLAERLATRDFEVSTVFGGEEGITWIKEHETDVVLLDVLMPGKDGIETLKEMKQIKPLLEVMMLTGHGTIETAIQGMRLGAYDYLMKPTDMTELVEKINKAAARKAEQEGRIRQAEIDRIVKTRGW